MPGHVQVGDTLARHGLDIGQRVEAEIGRVDIDVVDVQQQLAIRFVQDRANKAGLVQLAGQARIGRDVFDDQRPLQHLLHGANALGDPLHGLRRER